MGSSPSVGWSTQEGGGSVNRENGGAESSELLSWLSAGPRRAWRPALGSRSFGGVRGLPARREEASATPPLTTLSSTDVSVPRQEDWACSCCIGTQLKWVTGRAGVRAPRAPRRSRGGGGGAIAGRRRLQGARGHEKQRRLHSLLLFIPYRKALGNPLGGRVELATISAAEKTARFSDLTRPRTV